MQQFKIRQGGFKEIRNKQLLKSIPLLIIAAAVGIVISMVNSKNKEATTNTLPIIIPIALGSLSLGIYRGLNRLKALFDSYTLTIDKNLISRQQFNTPEISIYYNDISEISKNASGGFTIKGKVPTDIISVPSQIDKYDELEQSLNQIKAISEKATETILQKYRMLLSLVNLGLMAVVFIAKNKILIALCGPVLVTLLSWNFYSVRVNKSIDNKTKQGMLWVLIVIAAVIGVTIFKLTAHYPTEP